MLKTSKIIRRAKPITVELFTLCTQYVFAYTFQLDPGLKQFYLHILKRILAIKKLNTLFESFVSYV